MRTKALTSFLSISILVLAGSSTASAQAQISNWDITGTTLSFDLSGTLTGATPTTNRGFLWITPTPSDVTITNSGQTPSVVSNTLGIVGSPGAGNPSVTAQDSPTLGDGIYITWGFDLDTLDSFSGSYEGNFFNLFSATEWADETSLDLYWGRDTTLDSGTFQSVVVVPEMATAPLLLGLAALSSVMFIRRRQLGSQ